MEMTGILRKAAIAPEDHCPVPLPDCCDAGYRPDKAIIDQLGDRTLSKWQKLP